MKSYTDIDEAYKKVAVRFGSNVADEIFLKESEDERIRKFLIGYFDKLVDENSEWGLEQETRNKIVAWLEKQGENQNNVYDKELSEIFGRVIRRYINDPNIPYTKREKVSMEIISYVERLEKQCEQNHVIEMKTPEESLDIDSDTYNKIVDECIYGEQKPAAWSEEDEKMLNSIISSVTASDAIDGTISVSLENHEKKIEWLKSLRPQPNQEWSEEDKNMLQSILDEYKSMPTEKRNWLKSLKERYTWKPSDEQMKQLCWIAEQNKDNMIGKELMTLYNDLKKLKE